MINLSLYDKIAATSQFLNNKTNHFSPQVGIILGSGLGGLTAAVQIDFEVPYHTIPHFPVSTVEGHDGRLIFGRLGSKRVIMMSGRFHYYEGYSMEQVTFPVRVMKHMGATHMMVSNAAGGMNPNYDVGDIVLIKDHINTFPEHPLRGPNDPRLGVRFLDMSEPYHYDLLDKAMLIAKEQNLKVHQGVYVGLQGPTFETRAEYKYLHTIGGDLVGMSTVPEVIVARHGGMKVFGISVITDLGIRDELNVITHQEVLEAAEAAAPKMAALVSALVQSI